MPKTVYVAPSRGRGLKRHKKNGHIDAVRRPFTGAWIETREVLEFVLKNESRPFTGAWIETQIFDLRDCCLKSPLHGGVD